VSEVERTILGVLTPSSNTRLEPPTSQLVSTLPGVSAHFSRFRVVDVGLAAANQFDAETILVAAELLADACVDSIVWSGTSGGWRGIADDRALCAAITERTGIVATTSTLALLDALSRAGASTVGLVTPYPPDMHAAVVTTLEGEGFEVVSSVALPSTASNWALSLIELTDIEKAVAEVATAQPSAVTVFCTNLVGADCAEDWERATGVPVFDSTSLALWHGLELAGYAGPAPAGWGSLFALPGPVG
jgi:maleate isomerase